MYIYSNNSAVNIEHLIADEVKRLSAQFGKSFLDCDDIIKLTGLGRDNVRALMRSRRFPVTKVVAWQMSENAGGNNYAA